MTQQDAPRSARLSRRRLRLELVVLGALALAAVAGATLVLRPVGDAPPLEQAAAPGPAPAPLPRAAPGPLPRALELDRLARGEGVAPEEARRVVDDARRPLAERYLALRRLEAASGEEALPLAEGLVARGGRSKDDALLALNALGVLARRSEGRAALARCAHTAPSAELRQAARALLARR